MNMKTLEIAEKSSTLYNLGDDGSNDIWFKVNKHKAGREAEIEAAREIMKRHNMHDKLVEALEIQLRLLKNYKNSLGPDKLSLFGCDVEEWNLLTDQIEKNYILLTQAKGE